MEEKAAGTWDLSRRSAIKLLAAGTAASQFAWAEWLRADAPQKLWVPNSWHETTRPEFVWESHEDRMYHDLEFSVPEMQTAPEFVAFMRRVWVFNKAMQWHRENLEDCILCHTAGRELWLTGENQLSRWHSDERNTISQFNESTRFEKKSGRHRDCAVLPAFQFHLGQNPEVEMRVTEASAPWQFCVSIKGRSGPPFLSTGWQTGPKSLKFDVAGELKKRGYALNFAELHFVFGIWTDNPSQSARVTYALSMPSRAAVIGSLPVIRTENTARAQGVPIVGVVVDESGKCLDSASARMRARIGERTIEMTESGGVWKASVRDLGPGNYEAILTAEGAVNASTVAQLRVNDGRFLSYDKNLGWMTRDGKPIGTLTGSYQGTFYFKDVGLPTESLINTQQEWEQWDRSKAPGEHLHYWESLTENELDQRFSRLQECGWDLLHLHQHWGIWERLDGGGRISPHGAEQVALYLRVAGRHNLALLQSLSSYEYALHRDVKSGPIGGTPPWSVYVDAGFRDEDWFQPEGTSFQKLFHQYLSDYTTLFKEETALAGMLASGEGDHENGPAFTNDVFEYVRSKDTNHFFPAETLFAATKLPRTYSARFKEELFGERTYFVGDNFYPEYELGVMFKYLQTSNNYLAEGSWPTPNIYTALHYELLNNDHKDPGPESWTGTLRYRNRLRDTYYLGFVHRMPILDTWDEYFAEDEHFVLRRTREMVDWKQPFLDPTVAVRVADESISAASRAKMVAIETAFAKVPLAYRYVLPEASNFPKGSIVLDWRDSFQGVRFKSEGGWLPDEVKEQMPLRISPGYCANYSWSADHRTLLAYIYNTTNHTKHKLWICGTYHRIPKPTELSLQLCNFPVESLRYRLYDLNAKNVAKEGDLLGQIAIALGNTDRDYLFLVTPE